MAKSLSKKGITKVRTLTFFRNKAPTPFFGQNQSKNPNNNLLRLQQPKDGVMLGVLVQKYDKTHFRSQNKTKLSKIDTTLYLSSQEPIF